jgi:hypothetical protein
VLGYAQQWSHKGLFGERITPGNPEYDNMLPLQAFLHMMPPAQLVLMLELTKAKLAAKEKQATRHVIKAVLLDVG